MVHNSSTTIFARNDTKQTMRVMGDDALQDAHHARGSGSCKTRYVFSINIGRSMQKRWCRVVHTGTKYDQPLLTLRPSRQPNQYRYSFLHGSLCGAPPFTQRCVICFAREGVMVSRFIMAHGEEAAKSQTAGTTKGLG